MQNQRQEITQQEGDTTSDESAISMIKRIFAVAHLLVKADIHKRDEEAGSNIQPQNSMQSDL
jgi:hypothetical protein